MFIGEFAHNLDEKGRLAIPVKFRNVFKKGAVVTKGIDNCLFMYTKEQWEKIAVKFASPSFNLSNARAYARHMLAGAMDVEFDSQGRVTLPEYLRQFAGLKKKVIVTGIYDRLEIWDEESWTNYKIGIEKDSSKIAEALGEIGI